ncbi:MFS transporter [Sulfodiicoccus acidiphilus]|nr:MFS transporter [Sulfodiicoccus acidiphilus]
MTEEREYVETDLLPRLDRLPWSRWHWKVFLILSGGMLLEGLVLSLGGSTLGTVEKLFSLTSTEAVALTPAFLVGELVGGVVLGTLADIKGRKLLFLTTMMFIIVGSLLAAVSVDYAMLLASRVIAGLGIGGELGAAIAAMEEFSPPRNRGFVVGTGNGVMFDFGTFIASFVGYFAISSLPLSIGWRVAFLSAVVLALVILIARLDLPESVRFLVTKGRIAEAQALVERVEKEVASTKGQLPPPGGKVRVRAREERATQSFSLLFKRYGKRVALAWTLNFSETWPYYAAFSVFPLIFIHDYHVPSGSVGLVLGEILGAGVLGVLTMAYLLDSLGRRPVLILSYGLSGALAVILGLVVSRLSFTAFVAFLAALEFFTYAAAALLYPQIGEMFPTEARGSGLGTAIGFGRLGGIIGPFVLLALEPLGLDLVFAVTGVVLFAGAIAEALLGPELKRKPLEEASRL